jgi:uncharacterized protein YutD
MTKGRFRGHICDTYFRKEDDEIFEYCRCGARYFLNRKIKPFDTEYYINEGT